MTFPLFLFITWSYLFSFSLCNSNVVNTDPIRNIRGVGGSIWAVLIAGSKGYENYRHQADLCHAYQLLKRNGVPDSNIIVMMNDDLAKNSRNPVQNNIINWPDGDNLYPDMVIDYKGKDVTKENIKKVLLGEGSGEVLKSGPDDIVFLYYSDHGSAGLLTLPNEEVMWSKEFIQTIYSMYSKKMYNKMVIYVEACFSGSIFENILRKDINVYAATASNAFENSFAFYFDKTRKTFVGDMFSIFWMEDTDSFDIRFRTIKDQMEVVRDSVTSSHVSEYGDLSIAKMKLSKFQGPNGLRRDPGRSLWWKRGIEQNNITEVPLVSGHDVPYFYLVQQLNDPLLGEEERETLKKEIQLIDKHRLLMNSTIDEIIKQVTHNETESIEINTQMKSLFNRDCYEHVAQTFSDKCFKLARHDYALRHMFKFVNLCETGYSPATIVEAILRVCRQLPDITTVIV